MRDGGSGSSLPEAVRRMFEEFWSHGAVDTLRVVMTSDFAGHDGGGRVEGSGELGARMLRTRQQLGSPVYRVDTWLTDGELVATAWSQLQSNGDSDRVTGARAKVRRTGGGVTLWRLRSGLIAEAWVVREEPEAS